MTAPAVAPPPGTGAAEPWRKARPEDFSIPPEAVPDTSQLVVEDDTPVDSLFAEKQQRLLGETLEASWDPGRPFLALVNVGLFSAWRRPPVVPDAMLALDPVLGPVHEPDYRSYFTWVQGKPPDVVVEVVSADGGDELEEKLRHYERIGVPHYVVHDPLQVNRGEVVRVFTLVAGRYVEQQHWHLPRVGLRLRLWEGTYGGVRATWLRWCDEAGQFIPTGADQTRLAGEERRRADQLARENALLTDEVTRLREELRAVGTDRGAAAPAPPAGDG